jgi:hypothetical protein
LAREAIKTGSARISSCDFLPSVIREKEPTAKAIAIDTPSSTFGRIRRLRHFECQLPGWLSCLKHHLDVPPILGAGLPDYSKEIQNPYRRLTNSFSTI